MLSSEIQYAQKIATKSVVSCRSFLREIWPENFCEFSMKSVVFFFFREFGAKNPAKCDFFLRPIRSPGLRMYYGLYLLVNWSVKFIFAIINITLCYCDN